MKKNLYVMYALALLQGMVFMGRLPHCIGRHKALQSLKSRSLKAFLCLWAFFGKFLGE